MTRVVVTPRAVEDLQGLIAMLGLPENALERIQRSLRTLERFPRAGRALPAPWQPTRCLIGPWPWMLLLYLHDEEDDAALVVAVHDARSSSAATGV